MITVGHWTLDPRQEHNAIGGCRQAFGAGHKHVLMCAPTGFGKTVTTAALTDLCARKGNKVGIIMSGRTLVFQMSDTLVDAQIPHSVLMNDSGHTFDPKCDVAVISKDTFASRRKTSIALSGYQPDIWIIDEADVCVSAEWQELFKLAPLRIGMTATPCDGQGKGLGHTYTSLVIAANYSELIQSGRLVDVPEAKCFSPVRPDLTGIRSSKGDYVQKSLSDRMNDNQMVGDIVKHWQLLGEDMPTLVCCVDKAHTVHVCQEFNDNGIAAEYVIDTTDQETREAIFQRTRDGQTKVIVNCATLTRGFDLPEIGCLVLAKPTKRLRTYIQMVGRALRAHPSKQYAIVIDHSGAVWDHGWPTMDRFWTLDTEVNAESLNAKANPKDKPERYCPKCSALIKTGTKCPNPNCGYEKTTVGQPAQMADGTLVPVKHKDTVKKQDSKSNEQKLWCNLLGRFAHSGKTYAQAATVFKKQTGNWPERAGVNPTAANHERQLKVAALWPGFNRKKTEAASPLKGLFE
jgi:DNA repair protein RadD